MADEQIKCPRCGVEPEQSTSNGFYRCPNNHLWRGKEFIVRDEACEAALDGYLPGFSASEIWAFREAWKLAHSHAQKEVDAAVAAERLRIAATIQGIHKVCDTHPQFHRKVMKMAENLGRADDYQD